MAIEAQKEQRMTSVLISPFINNKIFCSELCDRILQTVKVRDNERKRQTVRSHSSC